MRSAKLAIVIIGRNEGQRLVDCLDSLTTQKRRVVYVDSGSVDNSVKHAGDAGAEVVELTPDRPFSAARARNAGFEQLRSGEMPDFVQFLDGDCILDVGWLDHAAAALAADESLGLVTGWRREMYPERSIYNDLCHHEWNRPAGEILTCGGDMLVRCEAFESADGFDESVIAAEDDAFCIRLRKAGWKMRRIPFEMSHHDAAMTRFAQWWQRAVRSGHGFAQVGFLYPPYFVVERRRVAFYGAALPLLALLLAFVWPWGLVAIAGVYGISFWKTVKGLRASGLKRFQARRHAIFLTLSKFPNVLGMILYHRRRLKRQSIQIIEYK